MGSFFSNLHVRGDGAAVRAALDAALSDRGLALQPAGAGASGPPARSVLVVEGGGWVSVYDEGVDADPDATTALARAVSQATGGLALTVTVHDSDLLLLSLVQAGLPVDQYHSWPGYFDGEERRVDPDAHLPAWAAAFPGQEAALRRLFGWDEAFAEGALGPLAAATGLSVDRLGVGYRYAVQGGELQGAEVRAYGLTDAPDDGPVAGPPRLRTQWQLSEEQHGYEMPDDAVQPVVAAVGARLQVGCTARNAGGHLTGLTVRVTGGPPGVTWEEVRVVVGMPQGAPWHTVAVSPDGTARLPTLEVPGGGGALGIDPAHPGGLHQAMAALYASQVHANVVGTAEGVGEGPVTVTLAPMGGGTGTEWTTPVRVRTTAGRPLRAPEDVHPSQLEVLESADVTVALAVVRPEALAEAVRTLAAAAAPHTPSAGRAAVTRYPAAKSGLRGFLQAAMGRPKTATCAAADALSGAAWRGAIAALEGGAAGQVDVTWADAEDGPVVGAHLSAGRGLYPRADALPAVVVSLPGAPLAPLSAALDALAAAGALVQATGARWGQPAAVDNTPYELAVGLHGQCTLDRAWVTRWVRAVGETLWLGPELAERVDPGAVAGASQLGDTLRVAVEDRASVERGLADLLPDAADWQAHMQRRPLG